MKQDKPKVIFVGSFLEKAKDGSVGGQMFACRSLIQSELSQRVDFILLDSTAESVPAPPVHRRASKALGRLFSFFLKLFNRKVTSVLIFTSAGFSFVEKGTMVILASLFGKKTILAPRSGISKDDYQNSRFFKWFMPFVIKKADIIICQGNNWKQFYMKISGEEESKFVVIKNWIDLTAYKKSKRIKDSSSLLINVLYLGWLETYKGIFDLIEAINLIKNTNLNFKLKICGMGSCKEKMLEMIEEYQLSDQVEYAGWITGDHKIKALEEADIFILPSHREGMPNALIEAMASSLAVIATKVGGIPELVEHNVTGILVDEESPRQISDAFLLLLNDAQKRGELSSNAYLSVKKNNSVESVVKEFEKLLV